MLVHIGEVDSRRLFAREGCSSMFEYYAEVLRLSEAATAKRVRRGSVSVSGSGAGAGAGRVSRYSEDRPAC